MTGSPASVLVTWITIAAAGAGIVARFVAIEEAKTNHVAVLADLQSRVGTMERSNTVLLEVQSLKRDIAVLNTQLSGLAEQLQDLRERERRAR